jgi:hypothetical protein
MQARERHAVLRGRLIAALGVLLALALWLAIAPAWANDCGREGQRPCKIDERIPSCDLNLVEGAGQCVRPACGREGERPCSVGERMGFDLVLKAPVPQPCDFNLKVEGGVCVHPACGREGQNACPVWTRVPSCDVNLVEATGRCIRPNCGRPGQRPCDLVVRGPFRQCDADLIIRADQCTRPGVPGNVAGGSQPAPPVAAVPVNAPPPPPPGRNAPPPPPPPVAAAPAPVAAAGMEPDTDRMGADMYGFALVAADPAMCQTACNVNAQCMAWTYLKPGLRGPQAQCFLKNGVPAPTRNNCCVSGTRGAAAAPAAAPRALMLPAR